MDGIAGLDGDIVGQVVSLEQEFDIEIDPRDVERMASVGDAWGVNDG